MTLASVPAGADFMRWRVWRRDPHECAGEHATYAGAMRQREQLGFEAFWVECVSITTREVVKR